MAWSGNPGSGSLNMGIGSGNSLYADTVSCANVWIGSLFSVSSLGITSIAHVGSAAAIPATADGYLTIQLQDGTLRKIAYFKV